MREKLNTATNLLVLIILIGFLVRPGGYAGEAWNSWKAARNDRALTAA
jgi:hypothetical protein